MDIEIEAEELRDRLDQIEDEIYRKELAQFVGKYYATYDGFVHSGFHVREDGIFLFYYTDDNVYCVGPSSIYLDDITSADEITEKQFNMLWAEWLSTVSSLNLTKYQH